MGEVFDWLDHNEDGFLDQVEQWRALKVSHQSEAATVEKAFRGCILQWMRLWINCQMEHPGAP